MTDFGLATRNSMSHDFRCGSEFYMSPGEHISYAQLFVELTRAVECMGYSSVDAYSTQQNDVWALVSILVISSCSSRLSANSGRYTGQHDYLPKSLEARGHE